MSHKQHNIPPRTLATSILAYYDSFAGLIPCRVMNEPPCDWMNWEVGFAQIVKVERIEVDNEETEEELA